MKSDGSPSTPSPGKGEPHSGENRQRKGARAGGRNGRRQPAAIPKECILPASEAVALAAFARSFHLTQREREVLRWVCTGAGNQEIAAALGVSMAAVRLHLRNIYQKSGAQDKVELVLNLWQLSPQLVQAATRSLSRPEGA